MWTSGFRSALIVVFCACVVPGMINDHLRMEAIAVPFPTIAEVAAPSAAEPLTRGNNTWHPLPNIPGGGGAMDAPHVLRRLEDFENEHPELEVINYQIQFGTFKTPGYEKDGVPQAIWIHHRPRPK